MEMEGFGTDITLIKYQNSSIHLHEERERDKIFYIKKRQMFTKLARLHERANQIISFKVPWAAVSQSQRSRIRVARTGLSEAP